MYREALAAVVLLVTGAAPAAAQIDPLLFLKRSAPNILLMIDTGERMQRDAPTDPANPIATSSYYDPHVYTRIGSAAEATLGVTATNTDSHYRRKYVNLTFPSGGPDKYRVSTITAVTDTDPAYATFEAPTRLSIARAALYQAIAENQTVARFGLYTTRQNDPALAAEGNSGPVAVDDSRQNGAGTTEAADGRWYLSRPTVAAANGANGSSGPGVSIRNGWRPDDPDANATILAVLAKNAHTAGGLLAAGWDEANAVDAPVQYMVDDLKSEALRLALVDAGLGVCRNTVAILVTGGGEGTTAAERDPVGSAAAFLAALPGRRVPIIVIAVAPPAADVSQLRAIATASGGQYFEIPKASVDAALAMRAFASPVSGTAIVPEMVRAIDAGVQTAFQEFADLNTAPFWGGPWVGWKGYAGSTLIPSTEFQVTSPTVGTVDLDNARDISGAPLPNTIVRDKAGARIPQRSNVMVTAGFVLPGFDGILRGFRMFRPIADPTQASGYRFAADGTRLWIARTPADIAERNLFTALPDGQIVPFATGSAAALAPWMNVNESEALTIIDFTRRQPLGAIVDSTPVVMGPPSLDPPPDDDYAGFAAANRNRRSIVWVGTNRGIIEAIDARTGLEVWGFIPLNLLPKLKTLVDGQPVGRFDFLADGSARVADVKIDGVWKTYLITGEGPGGTFYQAFDVTMADMAAVIDPASDATTSVLRYFADPARIKLVWAFPRYTMFDPRIAPYGDVNGSASPVEKTVGQTWSDPVVGRVAGSRSSFAVLMGSGFLPHSAQRQSNRGGTAAGTTFYLLDPKTGAVLDSHDVGSDGVDETVDDCAASGGGCRQMKNALQGDPAATGPAGSSFISAAYIGDLDGNIWRFDLTLDRSSTPAIGGATRLFANGGDQPVFSSVAAAGVGSAARYVFYATGSDLLPATDKNTRYRLVGLLDTGATATRTFERALTKSGSGNTLSVDERATAYPAVAGDIVFFTTTTFRPASPCALPDANLYAFTFAGGPAYDNTADDAVSGNDTPLVKTVAGQRATAPFIVDRHLAFGTLAGSLELFGGAADFNQGIGQASVRILSWRRLR